MSQADNEPYAFLYLKKGSERRIASGHLWVYSNEVDTGRSPLKDLMPGQGVDVLSHAGRWLGNAYVNPNSLICARIVSHDRSHPLSRSLLVHRIKVALGLRRRLFRHDFYRLLYGEGDGLPGLIIDRYGSFFVVQLNTAGMDRRREDVLAALDKVLRPEGVLLRCDNEFRAMEGLDSYVEALGRIPEEVEVIEHDTRFIVPLRRGQKTGWYFDQRGNRAGLLPLVAGGSILDVCSYTGAWGLQAATHGATRVHCVDASETALDYVRRNAELNEIASIQTQRGDAFKVLKGLRAEGARFDVVVLDPPAFIKRKKDQRAGEEAYRRLNQKALQVLNTDGLLVSCSCSYHLSASRLLEITYRAARHVDRHLQLLVSGGQSMDHPVHPAMPETRYLKCLIFRVLPRL